MEKPSHKCGIYGMYGNCTITIFEQIKYGLEKIQHRGRECTGISYFDEDKLKVVKGCGLVNEVINENKLINSIPKNIAPLKSEYVGNYALRIYWNDEHDSGIFHFNMLREFEKSY